MLLAYILLTVIIHVSFLSKKIKILTSKFEFVTINMYFKKNIISKFVLHVKCINRYTTQFLNNSNIKEKNDFLFVFIIIQYRIMILKVVVEFLAIKILKGFGKTRVGIDDENINLHRGTNPQPSFKIEQNKVSNETTEENLSNQSINKNENIVPESEINVPSNISAEENLNNQQHEVNSENKKKKKKRKKKKKKIVTEEEL